MRSIAVILLGVALLFSGWVAADDSGEPPIRLKKKVKPAGKDANDQKKGSTENPKPGTPAPSGSDVKPKNDAKESENKPKDNPLSAGSDPEIDGLELTKQVAKNMQLAQDQISKGEIKADGMRQLQRDILKDLDTLIDLAQKPPHSSRNPSSSQPSPTERQNKQDSQNSENQSSSDKAPNDKTSNEKQNSSSSSDAPAPSEQPQAAGRQNNQEGKLRRFLKSRNRDQMAQGPGQNRKPNSRRQSYAARQPQGQGTSPEQNPKWGPEPKQPSMTKKDSDKAPGGGGGNLASETNKLAEVYKDIWGHLPETQRAEMNAYFRQNHFMSKYEELIKQYYSTIAEKSRRKGS